MKYVVNFFMFWYDLIVGDNPRLAIGVVVALIICGVGVSYWHLNPWWLMPILVTATLAASLAAAKRK